MIKPNEKIKLFTHTDLDGIGSIVILGVVNYSYNYTLAYPDAPEGQYASNSIGYHIREFINSGEYKEYDRVYITDLYINTNTAGLIETVNGDGRFKVFDHHVDSIKHDRPWIIAKIDFDGVPTCGTELFWDHVAKENNLVDKMSYKQFGVCTRFVEAVRLYDTWEWSKKESVLSNLALSLNELYHAYGVQRFTSDYINILLSSDSNFIKDNDKEILDYISRDKEIYIKKKAETAETIVIDDILVSVVFAEKYTNDVLSYILQGKKCDIAALINLTTRTVSLRTASDKISVGELAKKYNGGGHQKAAGFTFSDTHGRQIIKNIFDI